MILGRRPRSKRPPKRFCEDCGGEFYAWGGVKCPSCLRFALGNRPPETLREFRRRLRGENG